MEQEKENCKHCYNCGYYSPYYTKGYLKFSKTNCGYCRQKRAMVDKHGDCDRWANIKYRYNLFDKAAIKKALYEVLSQLSEIRQIIEEAQKGNEAD